MTEQKNKRMKKTDLFKRLAAESPVLAGDFFVKYMVKAEGKSAKELRQSFCSAITNTYNSYAYYDLDRPPLTVTEMLYSIPSDDVRFAIERVAQGIVLEPTPSFKI